MPRLDRGISPSRGRSPGPGDDERSGSSGAGMTRWPRRLALAGLAILLLTAAAVAVAAAVMQQRHGDGRSLSAPVDAAIVLAAGIDPDGVLHWSTRRRVAAGAALVRAGLARRLVMSGGTGEELEQTAAALMRDHAVSLGVAPDLILLEERSATTFENIRFSFELAREAGLARLAVVTDDSHLLRSDALACYFGDCAIGLVSVAALGSVSWPEAAAMIGREAMAWWYNLGKVVAWSALGAAGMPESGRAGYVR